MIAELINDYIGVARLDENDLSHSTLTGVTISKHKDVSHLTLLDEKL